MKITGSWSGNGAWQQVLGNAAKAYTYSGWLKSDQPSGNWNNGWIMVSLNYMDANNNFISAITQEIYVSNTWIPFKISSIAPKEQLMSML